MRLFDSGHGPVVSAEMIDGLDRFIQTPPLEDQMKKCAGPEYTQTHFVDAPVSLVDEEAFRTRLQDEAERVAAILRKGVPVADIVADEAIFDTLHPRLQAVLREKMLKRQENERQISELLRTEPAVPVEKPVVEDAPDAWLDNAGIIDFGNHPEYPLTTAGMQPYPAADTARYQQCDDKPIARPSKERRPKTPLAKRVRQSVAAVAIGAIVGVPFVTSSPQYKRFVASQVVELCGKPENNFLCAFANELNKGGK